MELFRANGYNTFGAGKIHHGNMNKESIKRFDVVEFTESINDRLLQLPVPLVDSTEGTGVKKFDPFTTAEPSMFFASVIAQK